MIYFISIEHGYELLYSAQTGDARAGDTVVLARNRGRADRYAELTVREVVRNIVTGDVYVLCVAQRRDNVATQRMNAIEEAIRNGTRT